MKIYAENMHFRELNDAIREAKERELVIENCIGQRYIGSGASKKQIDIHGTPGNALGAYLDGAEILVHGNSQDAVGDTMNDGKIVVYGNAGDALGYAMRGGKIYVLGNAGYRTGIHMKEYKDKKPVIIVGGRVGSFLGEYQAGGVIIVLGLETDGVPVHNFCGTGMHGGKIYIRSDKPPVNIPHNVEVTLANPEDIMEYLEEYMELFHLRSDEILAKPFYVLKPKKINPHKVAYVHN